MKSNPKTVMHSRTTAGTITKNHGHKPIALPQLPLLHCVTDDTGQKRCKVPPKALPSFHMVLKEGGETH